MSERMVTRPIYNKDDWVLCICCTCGRVNYVEPHGTTAACACATDGVWVEHASIPYTWGDPSGFTARMPSSRRARLEAIA